MSIGIFRDMNRNFPPSLLYDGYWVSFLLVKLPGRGVDHPPPI